MSGSTSWRESRTYKLAHQFKDGSGCGGTQHLSDLVEMETEMGRKDNGDQEQAGPDLREGWQDIRNLIKGTKKRKSKCFSAEDKSSVPIMPQTDVDVRDLVARTGIAPTDLSSSRRPEEKQRPAAEVTQQQSNTLSPTESKPPQIFRSLVLYINGSTAPLVSDHRLKQLWVQYGGSISIALGRRTVTHVVLGDSGSGGGGLASGKIQKEIDRIRGKGVKYVSARWVLDCVERGKRVSEARYGVVERKIGGAGQGSVRGMFRDGQ
jgi:BRCT domain, a BRCA1 C-terminus domain